MIPGINSFYNFLSFFPIILVSPISFYKLKTSLKLLLYLKYFLHLCRKMAAFPFSSSASSPQNWYADPLKVLVDFFSSAFGPLDFLVADSLLSFSWTPRNCRLSIKILPRKNTKIAHSRPLNGMLDVSRQRAKCKPSSAR